MPQKNNFKELYQSEIERFETFQADIIREKLWHTTGNYKFMGQMVDLYVNKFFEIFFIVNSDIVKGIGEHLKSEAMLIAEPVEDLTIPFENEIKQLIRHLKGLIAEGNLEKALSQSLRYFQRNSFPDLYQNVLQLQKNYALAFQNTSNLDKQQIARVKQNISSSLNQVLDSISK